MQSTVTDGIAWSRLSRSWALQKRLNRSRFRLDCGLGLAQIPCIRWRSRSPVQMGNFEGKGWPIVNYWDSVSWGVQKLLNRSRCHLGCRLGWVQKACIRWRCTLALTGEYDWTVHVRLRCGLFCQMTLTYSRFFQCFNNIVCWVAGNAANR